jgi:hypothetical protein
VSEVTVVLTGRIAAMDLVSSGGDSLCIPIDAETTKKIFGQISLQNQKRKILT